jgi:hypothetical protein
LRLIRGEYVHVTADPRVVTDKIQLLGAWDFVGRVWRVSRRVMKRLREQVAELEPGAPGAA